MQNSDSQINKIQGKFTGNLNSVIEKHFDGRAVRLADQLNLSKSQMSYLVNGKRNPAYSILEDLLNMGFSIDYLISGIGSELINNSASLSQANDILNGNTFDVEIKDDKMATTLNHGTIATFSKISYQELEVGGIYLVEKKLGGKFIARLTGDNQWIFDNNSYNEFQYIVGESDKVSKLTKAVNFQFPIK